MKILQNDTGVSQFKSMILLVLVLILAVLAGGCVPQPTKSVSPPVSPLLPPSPTSTQAATPTITPTLPWTDNGLVYVVVGLSPDQTLPMYQEPSLTAGVTGHIPASGKSIRTTGIEIEADGITWLQVGYQESAGWVDRVYLARQIGDIPEELIALAHTIASALKTADYSHLEEFIHPELCLRFSPYPSLRASDLVFCPEQLDGLLDSSTLYTWGRYDGSGEPIELSFEDYHRRFVYDQDFFQPEIVGLNQEVSSGNAINNITEIFPDGMIVEYYFPGFDPQYGGMDWRSLRMVFVQEKGGWFLVALVHGEWTI